MTRDEAIIALLDEYELQDFEDFFRDEAKQDVAWTELAALHPKVVKFRECCRVLRQAIGRR